MGVYGRDLGHVSDDVVQGRSTTFGVPQNDDGTWHPVTTRPTRAGKKTLEEFVKIVLSGEYTQDAGDVPRPRLSA